MIKWRTEECEAGDNTTIQKRHGFVGEVRMQCQVEMVSEMS